MLRDVRGPLPRVAGNNRPDPKPRAHSPAADRGLDVEDHRRCVLRPCLPRCEGDVVVVSTTVVGRLTRVGSTVRSAPSARVKLSLCLPVFAPHCGCPPPSLWKQPSPALLTQPWPQWAWWGRLCCRLPRGHDDLARGVVQEQCRLTHLVKERVGVGAPAAPYYRSRRLDEDRMDIPSRYQVSRPLRGRSCR